MILEIILTFSLLVISLLLFISYSLRQQKKARRLRFSEQYYMLEMLQKEKPLYEKMGIKVESCDEKLEEIDFQKFVVFTPNENISSKNEEDKKELFEKLTIIPFTVLVDKRKPYLIFQKNILTLYPEIKTELDESFNYLNPSIA